MATCFFFKAATSSARVSVKQNMHTELHLKVVVFVSLSLLVSGFTNMTVHQPACAITLVSKIIFFDIFTH